MLAKVRKPLQLTRRAAACNNPPDNRVHYPTLGALVSLAVEIILLHTHPGAADRREDATPFRRDEIPGLKW